MNVHFLKTKVLTCHIHSKKEQPTVASKGGRRQFYLEVMCVIASSQSPYFDEYFDFTVTVIKKSLLTFALTISDFIIRIC